MKPILIIKHPVLDWTTDEQEQLTDAFSAIREYVKDEYYTISYIESNVEQVSFELLSVDTSIELTKEQLSKIEEILKGK